IVVKALNNIVGPNSLVLTLLIFRVYLRINSNLLLSLDITIQAEAIRKAIKILYTKKVKVNINYIINTYNRLSTYNILSLLLSLEVIA
ncbi:hypothetical protein P154DRAFT_428856, partial [Amniculicola lignicola CBS 123094]